ncbi:SWIB complex BAF60b domain-containing protein [Zea mays]|uniref:SWIB complex BAF60b domain-containing protein n=1 Tax=Zea mays TaxID=4577 RepID=A0A1D6DUN6_MAIZE|nr:SWIB complex BAF60b domain-containing protein [Zea mays]
MSYRRCRHMHRRSRCSRSSSRRSSRSSSSRPSLSSPPWPPSPRSPRRRPCRPWRSTRRRRSPSATPPASLGPPPVGPSLSSSRPLGLGALLPLPLHRRSPATTRKGELSMELGFAVRAPWIEGIRMHICRLAWKSTLIRHLVGRFE